MCNFMLKNIKKMKKRKKTNLLLFSSFFNYIKNHVLIITLKTKKFLFNLH